MVGVLCGRTGACRLARSGLEAAPATEQAKHDHFSQDRRTDAPRRRFPRQRNRDSVRRDELGFRTQSGGRDQQWRRVWRDRLRGDDARTARYRNRRDQGAHCQALWREPYHHASAAVRSDRGLRPAQCQPCRARGWPAAQGQRGGDQANWREGHLLCPHAGAWQEAAAFRRRCAGDRGERGGRPYRACLHIGAGAGNPARTERGQSGVRRGRHRQWRDDRRLSGNGRGGRAIGHPLCLRHRKHRASRFQEGLFPRQRA